MNAADTGFILICAAMVFVMTPAVALFYGGLVSARNVLSTSFHSYASLGLVTVIWAFVGYTLAFGPDINGIIGSLKYVFLQGVEGTAAPSAANLPHPCFMMFQCMFACLTVALISGGYAERMHFPAMLRCRAHGFRGCSPGLRPGCGTEAEERPDRQRTS